jgi:hypothetical protein
MGMSSSLVLVSYASHTKGSSRGPASHANAGSPRAWAAQPPSTLVVPHISTIIFSFFCHMFVFETNLWHVGLFLWNFFYVTCNIGEAAASPPPRLPLHKDYLGSCGPLSIKHVYSEHVEQKDEHYPMQQSLCGSVCVRCTNHKF